MPVLGPVGTKETKGKQKRKGTADPHEQHFPGGKREEEDARKRREGRNDVFCRLAHQSFATRTELPRRKKGGEGRIKKKGRQGRTVILVCAQVISSFCFAASNLARKEGRGEKNGEGKLLEGEDCGHSGLAKLCRP